jgi:PadR family transcriptional regulator PadR
MCGLFPRKFFLIYLTILGIIPIESRHERGTMISKNLMAASTKPLILTILSRGEKYGYQIIHDVIQLSGGTLEWSEGMLYPVLHRMEKENLIRSQWKISKKGRKRKYYSLTEEGRKELESEKKQWMKVHKVLSGLWKPSPSFD